VQLADFRFAKAKLSHLATLEQTFTNRLRQPASMAVGGSQYLVLILVLGVVQSSASEANVCNADMDPSDPACVAAKQGDIGLGMVQKRSSIESATIESEGDAASSQERAGMALARKAIERDRTRVKLGVERDLSQLSANHYRSFDNGSSCSDNAHAAFTQFMDTSNLSSEMTPAEIQCFSDAFAADVVSHCKGHSETATSWDSEIRAAFNDEKPVVTHQMVEAMNAAHNISFTVGDIPCMTQKESREHMGLIGDDESLSASMLEAVEVEEDLVGNPPAAFNPDTTWPECASVIHAQHNQVIEVWCYGKP
jgi:hypothetical protein